MNFCVNTETYEYQKNKKSSSMLMYKRFYRQMTGNRNKERLHGIVVEVEALLMICTV